MNTPLTVILLSAASGCRTMTGLAGAAFLRAPSIVAIGAAVLAVGELIADKLPNIPDRITTPSLTGRMIAGAIIGATLGDTVQRRITYALIGAVTSYLSAHAGFRARRKLS